MNESKERQYWFQCPICGTKRVKENYFLKFLDSKLKSEINEQFKLGSPGAVIQFNKNCPLCKPNGNHLGDVATITPDPSIN